MTHNLKIRVLNYENFSRPTEVLWTKLAVFRLEYEDDYAYEFEVLSTRTSKNFAR